MRGADIPSDHHLLMTAVRFLFKKFNYITNKMKKYKGRLLKTKEVKTAFHLCLSYRFQPLQDQLESTDTNIATQWDISARCVVTHVKKSLEDERHSTKS